MTDPMTPQRLREIAIAHVGSCCPDPEYACGQCKRDADELRNFAEQLERNGWQPISTAPLGQTVWLWCATWRHPFPGLRNGDNGAVWIDTCEPEAKGWQSFATHWQPLPKPPGGEMTQERQDGWYWVTPKGGDRDWVAVYWSSATGEWIMGYSVYEVPFLVEKIGERIPSPDEPKDPDLLAVVKAAKEWRDAHSADYSWNRMVAADDALRSALAKLEERGS